MWMSHVHRTFICQLSAKISSDTSYRMSETFGILLKQHIHTDEQDFADSIYIIRAKGLLHPGAIFFQGSNAEKCKKYQYSNSIE